MKNTIRIMDAILRKVSSAGWAVSEGVVTADGRVVSFCINMGDWTDEDLALADTYPDWFDKPFDQVPFIKNDVQGKIPLNLLVQVAENSPTQAIQIYDFTEKRVIAGPGDEGDEGLVYNKDGKLDELRRPGDAKKEGGNDHVG